jgi:hypothetical protein
VTESTIDQIKHPGMKRKRVRPLPVFQLIIDARLPAGCAG